MEGFFDSLFPFLIIAAVVGLRIVSAVRNGRRNRSRNESVPAGAAPPKAARGFVPWEDAFRDDASGENAGPVQAVSAGDDETFSAWNLSVDDGPPSPSLPQMPEPGPPAAPAGRSRFPEVPGPDPFAAAPVRPGPARPEQRFRGLSPLQRGVLWAEILAPPKGLED
jgi:hypothetical protein